ncbi:MAG TPA: thiol peroxidase [Flexistipes sinusarabici]|uniref:Thiol peroxidase n=1 Tax=Flexistipes sinusarabici TaxID=2352 RepID=A0A3D5QB84_FLESI|nr:thiol peroxidase [Flexistipes sinusarabici]
MSNVTMKGNPLTLVGNKLSEGDNAPDFKVVDQNLQPKSLKDYSGKVKLISVTPSLDTPVCDMQARKFNEEAAKLGDNVAVLNISVDLPFAIKRFCNAAGIDKVETLSDYKDVSFGENYGVLIKELRLLARAVFVVDDKDIVRYMEVVPEVTDEPDYETALSELRKVTQ